MNSLYKTYFKSQAVRIPIGVGLLGVYGVFVCPFIDSLPWYTLAGTFGAGFGLALIPYLLFIALVFRNLCEPKNFFHRRVGSILVFAEMLYWLTGAYTVASLHEEIFRIPFDLSGIKIGVSSLLVGVLFSTLNLLAFEGLLLKNMSLESKQPHLPKPKFSTMSRKLIFGLIAIAMTSTFSISLLVFKDLNLVHYTHRKELRKTVASLTKLPHERGMASKKGAGPSSTATGSAKKGFLGKSKIHDSILLEIGFCLLTIFGFLFFIAEQFIENVKALLRMKAKLFENFRKESFDQFLPVLRHDEFGVISNDVNQIVLQLAEKNRVRSIFGKYISPKVAQRILCAKNNPQLGGENKEVSILFSDIRNYTQFSESIPPELLVPLLNNYFTEMVEIVNRHNGVLDKFIGDGLMAFFDLGPEENERSAARAAVEMVEKSQELAQAWVDAGAGDFKIGVGVHSGNVLIGNIGSEQRLEFTVIGSSVNMAARIESLSKTLPGSVAISKVVFERLCPELKARFTDSGAHKLKGLRCEHRVYYLQNKPAMGLAS